MGEMDNGSNGAGHLEELDESTELDIVEFEDEEGNKYVCAMIAIIEVDERDYAVLAPVEQLEDEEGDELEVFIFRYTEDQDGTELFAAIDDEAEFEKVQAEATLLLEEGPQIDLAVGGPEADA